ncbi:MAG TPA: DUF5317 family protein [Actinomycetota bacterium]|nr:DUF5317 family protein [Actinomycetota bacterium]
MILALAAVVLGVVAGLALGGSLRTLSETRVRWWPLALVGIALQALPVVTATPSSGDQGLGFWVLLLSYACLLTFGLANAKKPGFLVVVLGLALNATVIAANGGMPVTEGALRKAAGERYAEAVRDLEARGGAKHRLARPGDVLLPLADVIAVGAPVRGIYSVGDLIAYGGVFLVLAAATKGPPGKHRVRRRPAWGRAPIVTRRPDGRLGRSPAGVPMPSRAGPARAEPPAEEP